MKEITMYGSYDCSNFEYREDSGLPINSKKFKESPIFRLDFDLSEMDFAFQSLDPQLKRKLAFIVKDAIQATLEYTDGKSGKDPVG